jgi:hypothetical protein
VDQPVLVCKETPLKIKIFGKETEKANIWSFGGSKGF